MDQTFLDQALNLLGDTIMENPLLYIAVFLMIFISIAAFIAHLVHKSQLLYTIKNGLEYFFYKAFLGRLILGIFVILLLLLGADRDNLGDRV